MIRPIQLALRFETPGSAPRTAATAGRSRPADAKNPVPPPPARRIGFALRLAPAGRRPAGPVPSRRLVLAGRIGPAFPRSAPA